MNTTNTVPHSSETVKRPKYRDMVKAAITTLADRKGSSRQAISKYLIGTYGLPEDNRSKAFVRAALVEGVKSGDLIQTKGTGASGSFKIGKTVAAPKPKKPKAKETKKVTKKEITKDAKKEAESKTKKPKEKTTTKEAGPKKPKKEKADAKATKPKKPPNVLTPKVKKDKPVANKNVSTPKDPKAVSPLSAVTKIKAKLLFTSTPSKKKNGKASKLLTPKKVVVKTKQAIRKPKKTSKL